MDYIEEVVVCDEIDSVIFKDGLYHLWCLNITLILNY